MRILHRYKKNPCNVQYSIDGGGIEYGLLYNWYAATDAREITSSDDWNVPLYSEFEILLNYCGGESVAGGYLKSTSLVYWGNINNHGDIYSFNLRGNGIRGGAGIGDGRFEGLKYDANLLARDTWSPGSNTSIQLSSNQGSATILCPSNDYHKFFGQGVRLLRDSTTLSHGQTGVYIGNDGKIYPTICIGTQEWLAVNLAETQYRNGDTIPEVTDNSAWAALTTGALCAYNNDWNYVETTSDPNAINYALISGELPITVELIGNTTHTNNHIILESGSFTDIPGGTYTFKVTDALGCEESEIIEIPYSEPIALNSSYDIDRKTLETCTVFKGFDYTVFGFTGETMFDRVKITSVPTNGTLSRGLLDTILVNDELIYPSDFNNGLYYRTSSIEKVDYSDTIGFQVRVNGLWSNTATITINVNSCIFADDCIEYGYLYNWYAATDARNIANTGWHVSTDAEWTILSTYLGGNSITGDKLKETGTTYWRSPNSLATNEVKFNGRGGGDRNSIYGDFSGLLKIRGTWWCSSEYNATNAFYRFIQEGNSSVIVGNQNKAKGHSIRLVRDATPEEQLLTDGTYVENYIGNDLTSYKCVKIGTQIWLAENLIETQYRNGDPIPTVEDNTTWVGLTTGAKCAYDNTYTYVGCDEEADELTTYPNIEYGLLYNWYAVNDSRNLTADGWRVPTSTEVIDFRSYLEITNYNSSAVQLISVEDGGTDEVGFHGRFSGDRLYTNGSFNNAGHSLQLWYSTGIRHWNIELTTNGLYVSLNNDMKANGKSVRLVSDATGVADGTTTIYTGNDGKVYLAVAIAGLYWLAENLAETKYRNGDIIPEVTDNTTWSNLTTGALSAYDNNWNNVGRTKPAYYP